MRTLCISAGLSLAALCGHDWHVASAQVGYVYSDGLAGVEAKQQAEQLDRQLQELTERIALRNSVQSEKARPTLSPSASLERFCIRIYHYDADCQPTRPKSPFVLPDGVLGYAVRDASNFDPPTETKPATPPPAADAKPAPKPAAPPAQPTLDDLLGIKPKPAAAGDKPTAPATPANPSAPTSTPDSAPDQSKQDLDRLLSAQEVSDALKQAIVLMGDASKRLNDHADNGLGTQRVQEDVVKRLDQLLASLDKQKQQGSPSPSPSPKDGDSKSEPGAKKPQPGAGQGQPKPGGDGSQAQGGPTLQDGQLRPELESARAAWGSLPARVRAMLMQGTEDRFSARYKALTQEYYKRLAEENSK